MGGLGSMYARSFHSMVYVNLVIIMHLISIFLYNILLRGSVVSKDKGKNFEQL